MAGSFGRTLAGFFRLDAADRQVHWKSERDGSTVLNFTRKTKERSREIGTKKQEGTASSLKNNWKTYLIFYQLRNGCKFYIDVHRRTLVGLEGAWTELRRVGDIVPTTMANWSLVGSEREAGHANIDDI